jgi:hypothetical protein|tara:strand:- start:2300 stop:2947 length:648 start_codon:yes stop_codon:yes gene_type:complete
MNLLNLLNDYFRKEKSKGILTSAISFSAANVLNIFLNTSMEMNIQKSTFLSLYLFGNIFAYSLDIMFAKEKLFVNNKYEKVPLTDYSTRSKFLISSFFNKYFARYMILGIIDSIIGLILLKFFINLMNKYELLMDWKYRDVIIASFVVAFTYQLYLNHLRFDWAYEYKENFLLNIIIYIWFTLIILIVVRTDTTFKNEITDTKVKKYMQDKKFEF